MDEWKVSRKSTRNKKTISFKQDIKVTKTVQKKKKALSRKKVAKKPAKKEVLDAEALLMLLVKESTVLNNREMNTKAILNFTGNTPGYDK